MDKINEAVLEGVTRIANTKQVIDYLEPDVFSHTTITNYMTERVLYSLVLLLQKWEEKNGTKGT